MHLMSEASSSCEDFGNYASTPRSSCVCSAEGAGISRPAGRFATLALLRSRTRRIRYGHIPIPMCPGWRLRREPADRNGNADLAMPSV